VGSLPDGLPVALPDRLLVGPLGRLPDGSSDGSLICILALPLVGSLPEGLLVGPLIGLPDDLPDSLLAGCPVAAFVANPNGCG
jgi:hypothetical protein